MALRRPHAMVDLAVLHGLTSHCSISPGDAGIDGLAVTALHDSRVYHNLHMCWTASWLLGSAVMYMC